METRDEKKRDRLAELDEVGEYPPRWDPQPGDRLVGVVRRYVDVELKLSGRTFLCIVEKDDGDVETIFPTATVLKGEFLKLKPRVGERISVRYLGTPEGKDYKKFVLRCLDRPETAEPDWGAYDEEGEYTAPAAAPGGRGAAPPSPPRPTPPAADDDPFADYA